MKYLMLTLLFSTSLFAQTNADLLRKLVKNESYGVVIKIFDTPTSKNKLAAQYVFPEIQLKPRDVLYFYVPEEFANLNLSRLGFSHRQKGEFVERDQEPGLTSALVYSKSVPGDEYRHWGGPSSGELGAKFAENSPYPEYDGLYEWPKKGHRGLKSSKKIFKLISANVIRLQNLGADNVYVSKLDFEFMPKRPALEEVHIFTPGSNFGDPRTMYGRTYGGGQNHQGTFPDAISLSSKDENIRTSLPRHFTVSENKLLIKMPKVNKFSFIEIMCGDSHPDRVINRDGGYGSPGNAEVSVAIENSISGKQRTLAKKISIPPEGVMMISEINNEIKLEEGDSLVITNKVNKSSLYIMAVRMGFDN